MSGPTEISIASLNASVDRLQKSILDQPYIQTIPQDEPRWHYHSSEAARLWMRSAPFDASENPELQYQTFFYHEHGSDLIQLRVHDAPTTDIFTGGRDVSATPSHRSQSELKDGEKTDLKKKKKISFASYQNQKNHKRIPSDGIESGGNSSKLQEEIVMDTDEKVEDAVENVEPDSTLKRKRNSEDVIDREAKRKRESEDDIDREAKREDEMTEQKANKVNDNFKERLPKLLSPIATPLPGRLSPLGHLLPELLSPDLPLNILNELDKRACRRINQENGTDDVHNSGDERQKTWVKVQKKVEGDSDKNRTEEEGSQAMIVKISMGQKLRDGYRKLLRRKSSASEDKEKQLMEQSGSKNGVTLAQKSSFLNIPMKRSGSPPQTPDRLSSVDAASNRSARSTSKLEPDKKQNKLSVPSPINASTPASATSITNNKSTSNEIPPSSKSSFYTSESDRYLQIGKTLKAKATKLEKINSNSTLSELALLTNMESFCAFMLSFHASDCAALTSTSKPVSSTTNSIHDIPFPPPKSARRTWISLHGFWRFIWDKSDSRPLFKSLVGALGTVYCAKIFIWSHTVPPPFPIKSNSVVNSDNSSLVNGNVKQSLNDKDRPNRDVEVLEASQLMGRILSSSVYVNVDVREKVDEDINALLKLGQKNENVERIGRVQYPLYAGMSIVQAVRTVLFILRHWDDVVDKEMDKSVRKDRGKGNEMKYEVMLDLDF